MVVGMDSDKASADGRLVNVSWRRSVVSSLHAFIISIQGYCSLRGSRGLSLVGAIRRISE